MAVTTTSWGQAPDGSQVQLFTLTNPHGLRAQVTNHGAALTSLQAPDRNGIFGEVCLGRQDLSAYLDDNADLLGVIVGRFANRIAHATFSLDGQRHALNANEGPHHLHGGPEGFHRRCWRTLHVEDHDEPSVSFTYQSGDGEEGYPGNLSATVTYRLTAANEMVLAYEATADAPTPVNLTSHAYWNLASAGQHDMLGHELQIEADQVLPTDEGLIPTGELADVDGGPVDFRSACPIGRRLADLPVKGSRPRGYDDCFVLRPRRGLALAATVYAPETGRVMQLHTTEPGLQFYSGNLLNAVIGPAGRVYRQYHGFCLEPQHFPDAVNTPHFPSAILRPGQTYRHRSVYAFSVRG